MLDLENEDLFKKLKTISKFVKLTNAIEDSSVYTPDLKSLSAVYSCIENLSYSNNEESPRKEVLHLYKFISEKNKDERIDEFVPEFEFILDVVNEKIKEKGPHYCCDRLFLALYIVFSYLLKYNYDKLSERTRTRSKEKIILKFLNLSSSQSFIVNEKVFGKNVNQSLDDIIYPICYLAISYMNILFPDIVLYKIIDMKEADFLDDFDVNKVLVDSFEPGIISKEIDLIMSIAEIVLEGHSINKSFEDSIEKTISSFIELIGAERVTFGLINMIKKSLLDD